MIEEQNDRSIETKIGMKKYKKDIERDRDNRKIE